MIVREKMQNFKKFPVKLFFLLGFLLLGIYFQMFFSGFLPWDDDYNIRINPYYLQSQWFEIWTHIYFGMYIPVTSTFWAALYFLGDGQAFPFRVFNFCLHLLNTYLVFKFAQLWFEKDKTKGAWLLYLMPLIFSLHPLQVDAVAWISGGRDLLATTFALLSLICFFKLPNKAGFVLAGALFTLSLLSKPQVASLPIVIFLLSYVRNPIEWKKCSIQMLLWCVPVSVVTFLTYFKQQEINLPSLNFWQRFVVIFDSFGFYLSKILWPHDLTVDYGRTPSYLLNQFEKEFFPLILFTSLFLVLAFSAFKLKKKSIFLIFLSWVACLLPVSGIINFSFQEISTTSNHYAYFPMVFFSLFLIQLLDLILSHTKRASKALFLACSFCLIFYSVLSWQRVQSWQNPKIFFDTMLRQNENSFSAMMGLGQYYSDEEKSHLKALALFQQALLKKPKNILVISNITTSLVRLHRYEEAAAMEFWLFDSEFQSWMLRRNIDFANFLNALGSAMSPLGRDDLALLYICEAQAMNPVWSGYSLNAEKILARLRPKNPQINCPTFSSLGKFINTANAARLKQQK